LNSQLRYSKEMMKRGEYETEKQESGDTG